MSVALNEKLKQGKIDELKDYMTIGAE